MQEKPELNTTQKLSKDFWREHIKCWELGKLSQQAYCKQAGIKYATFGYWRKQFLLESGQSKARQFIPVEIKQIQPDASQSIKIKLTTGNVVCIPLSVGMEELAKFVRLMEAPNA